MVAKSLCAAVEVTLRKPPPLEAPLDVVLDGDRVVLRDADEIASAVSLPLELEVPEPPTYEAAVEAAKHYRGLRGHPYPGCFVCGPERAPDDGLRIFPGRIAGRELVAAPFRPARTLGESVVDFVVVWAALDCPGYFGATVGEDGPLPALLLGKMHAEVFGEVRVGKPHVVIGWPIGREGRKIYGATALFDGEQRLVAKSRQVWIAPKPAA